MDAATWGVAVSAAAGLAGAAIGGGASLFATRQANRQAERLSRLDRLDQAIVVCRTTMYRLQMACAGGVLPSGQLLDDVSLDLRLALSRAWILSPHLAHLLNELSSRVPAPVPGGVTTNSVKELSVWATLVGAVCGSWLAGADTFEKAKLPLEHFLEVVGEQ